MLVRHLKIADAQLLETLRLAIDGDSPGTLGHPWQRKQTLLPEQIKLELSNQKFKTYGAFIQDRLVGAASIAPTLTVPNWFGLFAVGVIPEFRGRKISRILIELCLKHAVDSEAEGVVLEVNVPNPAAKSLYDSLGFEIWNTVENAYVFEGTQYSELSMRKFLKGIQLINQARR
jgi:ribosomal protein S18 acetylase RimI-like enzyme